MEKIIYNNIIDVLLERFPEYKESGDFDKDSIEFQYAIVGGFGRFLTKKIEDLNRSEEFIQRAFQFINEVYNDPEDKSNADSSDNLQNLFYIEIFENLAQTKIGVEAARKYLEDRAKDEFETVFRYTGVEEYNPSDKNEAIVSKWKNNDK